MSATPDTFPVLLPYSMRQRYLDLGCPRSVPWGLMAAHEDQAMRNHGRQSLKVLNQRGGVSPKEMAAILQDNTYRETREMTEAQAVEIINEAVTRFPGKPRASETIGEAWRKTFRGPFDPPFG